MKIIDVEAIIVRQDEISLIGDGSQDTALIKVTTDTGLVGWGEIDSSPYVMKSIIDASSSHAVCRGIRELLIGEDPLRIDYLWKKMYDYTYYYGRRSAGIHAMSGVDMALWDITGQHYGVPIYKLMGGGFRTEIPAYCSVLMPGTEEEIRDLVESKKGTNFRGFKFGWGALGENPKKDIQLVEWCRKYVGDDKDLMIDIAMRWPDSKTAIRTLRAMEQYDIKWLEEPFSPDNLEGYKRLCAESDTWISAGEEVGTLHEFDELINNCRIDLIQPDISRCGGITVARKVTDMAALRNIHMIPHAFKTGILMSACLHLIATIPNALYLEYVEQETVLSKHMIHNHFTPDANGMVQIPQDPGLGIRINEETLERYRRS